MTSIQDKLNNFLVLEHFNLLYQENLKPKLGVYAGNRLIIASQKRTNFFAKIYQLFLDAIYYPILVVCKKLNVDGKRITDLKKEIEILKSDLSDKQHILNSLAARIAAKKQKANTYESQAVSIRRETKIIENELRQKRQALDECKTAESRITSLNLQIRQLENRLTELSAFEKQCAPADQKIKELRKVIYQLEEQIATLKMNAEQLSYKDRCKYLEDKLSSLQYALTKAEESRYDICLNCGAPACV
ncbi:hypothetical protein PHSC3_001562 [Chlamydiales bacterium STE3]|nr:hypothetical protein PHSC3_001562 [Chlamydiales bacterium STE3]